MTRMPSRNICFWRDQTGSLAVWFAFLIPFFIGVLGLAIEVGQLYMVKTRLQSIADQGALIAVSNRALLSNADITELARAHMTGALSDRDGLGAGRLDNVHIQMDWLNTEATPTVRVDLWGELPLTLLKVLNFVPPFNVSVNATAQVRVEPLDIAVVLDRSIAAGSAKLSTLSAGSVYLSEQLSLLQFFGADIRVGLLPGSGAQFNIAPRINWLEAGSWPGDNLPPNVPGHVNWTGALSQQRWCVGRRSGDFGTDLSLPQVAPFPLILTIDKTIDAAGVDTYSIAEEESCPEDRIMPLTSDLISLPAYVQSLSSIPSFRPERGIVWAGRLLDESWSAAWGNGSGSAQERRKVVLFLMVGAAASDWAGGLEFQDNCENLKASGITLNIIDFTEQASLRELNRDCAEAENYRDVASVGALNTALADFLKSLGRPVLLKAE